MKNYSSLITVAVLMLGAASCVPKVLLLQSPLVSAKKKDSGSVKNLSEGSEIKEKWCDGDKPLTDDDGSKEYGLLEQVTLKAHKNHKADYFSNARFYTQGGCIQLEAIAANAGSAPVSDSQEQEAPAAKPAKKKK